MKKGVRFFLALIFVSSQMQFCVIAPFTNVMDTRYHSDHIKRKKYCFCASPFKGDWNILHDASYIIKNIFLWDTYSVIVGAFPLYIAGCMEDDDLQYYFYDKMHHKNINQLPSWCHTVADASTVVPMVILGSCAFFSHDTDLCTTSRVFAVGIPLILLGKDLIKQIKVDIGLRPWNEYFDCKKRSYGGFPSGHMAELIYATVLYGKRFGARFAVPLGALSASVAGIFISCNRHYLSQLIAGAAWGAIFALASDKVVESNLSQSLKIGFNVTRQGNPALHISYSF